MPTKIQWRQFNRFAVILLARSWMVIVGLIIFSVRHIVSRNLNSVLCAWKEVNYNSSPCQFLRYLDSLFRRFDSGKVQFQTVKWHNFISARVAGAYYRKFSVMHADSLLFRWTRVCDSKLSVTFLPGARPGHVFMTLWIIALYSGCLLPRRTRDCDTCCLLLVQKDTWLWYSYVITVHGGCLLPRRTRDCDTCVSVACCPEGHAVVIFIITVHGGCLLPRRTHDCDTCVRLLVVQRDTWLWYS